MESYEKIREVGKGSYGVVWLVKNKKDRKNYVLKKIDLRKSSERDKKSAQLEAQLLKNLKHPNIVSYKESFQIDGYLHIVMLYCDGGDLYTKIKEHDKIKKRIEEAQIVEWFVQIAMALQYMHEKNILHRDLKTQNIFLTRNKIIKVGDLGIARVLKSTNDMATTIIGTPYYMSPEIFSNQPYNSKSDVWALGCCVYEMLTLKHAFNAKDMTSLMIKITRGKMPEIPKDYSKELTSLIESMLNLDPKKRPTANKILRDPFIKKNIMLFLERTKEKQKLQLESEPQQIVQKPPPETQSQVQKPIIVPRRSESDSEFIYANKMQKEAKSSNDYEGRENRDDNKKQPDKFEGGACAANEGDLVLPIKSISRVRISEKVIDIETREHYPLAEDNRDISKLNSDESHEDQQQANNIINEEPVRPSRLLNLIQEHSRLTPQFQVGSPSSPASPASPKMFENPQQSSLDPRERRRERLRLKQFDNSNESKPPVLKKYALKSNQSEVFYISKNAANNQLLPSSNQKHISKSYGDELNGRNNNSPASRFKDSESALQDSLKIFRQNANLPSSQQQQKPQSSKINGIERNAQQFKQESSSSSSSMSSVASSNEDEQKDDKIKEKIKRRDNKEINTLIDQLTLTLKAANKINATFDSEMDEEVKDEDLDEEVEEINFQQVPSNQRQNKPSENSFERKERSNSQNQLPSSKLGSANTPRKHSTNDDRSPEQPRGENSEPLQNNLYGIRVSNLNATNHMTQRINGLEKECLDAIGPQKLEQVFKILDSFKEDEVEQKLNILLGSQICKEFASKFWLLKFCKDTAKISIR